MTVNGVQIDSQKLLTKDELLGCLRGYGEDYRALSRVSEHYYASFGDELVWRYPISDGNHLGAFITVIKEGFISLPYDIIDRDDGELLELNDAAILDADTMQFFIDDWRSFSEDLINAMTDMLRILRDE